MIAGTYVIHQLDTVKQADRIVEFFFSPYSFDDTRYTPGEEEQLRSLPYRALRGEVIIWYVLNSDQEIIAVSCMAENEQKSGGYSWDYIVVHRQYRNGGIASSLLVEMVTYLNRVSARYLLTYTCSMSEYQPIRRMFERNAFQLIGCCPDYYYEGEDRLIYYRKLSS